MPTPYAPGYFVWHELMTNDREGAISFYSQLFGWTTKDRDMGTNGIYTMVNSGKDGLAGIMDIPEGMEFPPHWGVYISVDDVDAACKKAQSLGGEVIMPTFDLPDTGKAAVIKDPAGATFYVFSPKESYDMPDSRPGLVNWNELMSQDVEKATAFYTGLMGWDLASQDMGDQGTYWMMMRGEAPAAGAVQMPSHMEAPSYWLSYVEVTHVSDTVKKAKELGGQVYMEPQRLDDMGIEFAVLASPDGAAFGVVAMIS